MFTVFLAWVNPDSRVANPKCIINTRNAETNIQVLFTTNNASSPVVEDSPNKNPHPMKRNKIKVFMISPIKSFY
jgi:hypothetical protein